MCSSVQASRQCLFHRHLPAGGSFSIVYTVEVLCRGHAFKLNFIEHMILQTLNTRHSSTRRGASFSSNLTGRRQQDGSTKTRVSEESGIARGSSGKRFHGRDSENKCLGKLAAQSLRAPCLCKLTAHSIRHRSWETKYKRNTLKRELHTYCTYRPLRISQLFSA